jgi:flavodoxin
MKITVVYESLFGNTAAVARAIGEACGTNHQVAILSVDEALNALPFDADLLIVGAPTRPRKPESSATNRPRASAPCSRRFHA